MNKKQDLDFKEWWDNIGSGLTPLPSEDQEQHAKRVAYISYAACIQNQPKQEKTWLAE